MLQNRQLIFRPSQSPGIVSPLTVRSTGQYRIQNCEEKNLPRGFTQLFWVAEGEVQYFQHNQWNLAKDGDVFFYTAAEAHWLRAGASPCRYYWVTFDGPLIGNWLNRKFENSQLKMAGNCPIDSFEELHHLIGLPTIRAEREAAELGLRLLMQGTDSARAHSKSGDSREEEFCRKLERLLHEHHANPEFGIGEAARILGKHRSTLFRLYRDQRGIKPSAYLQRIRLKRGLELLRRSNLNINEIAHSSGFRDANYFTKAIHRTTGVSPRRVRKQGYGPG